MKSTNALPGKTVFNQSSPVAATVLYLASLIVALIKAELAMHKAFVHISTYHPKLEESPG